MQFKLMVLEGFLKPRCGLFVPWFVLFLNSSCRGHILYLNWHDICICCQARVFVFVFFKLSFSLTYFALFMRIEKKHKKKNTREFCMKLKLAFFQNTKLGIETDMRFIEQILHNFFHAFEMIQWERFELVWLTSYRSTLIYFHPNT